MDPNELVVILERAIANLPDPSADGRRRVYERVERTIRTTCTSEDGALDAEQYKSLRRDLGAAIAIIEKKSARPVARSHLPAQPVEAAPPPPPPQPAAPVDREPEVQDEVEVEDEASPPWLKRLGIGAGVVAVALGALIVALPGGPLNDLIYGGAGTQADRQSRPDPFAGAPAPDAGAEPPVANEPEAGGSNAFVPVAPQPGVPRVTDVKVAILNGASEWRTEPLSGFDTGTEAAPLMAVAQDRETPLLVSLYCDTPELRVFRVAFGSDPETLKKELAERGRLDGILRQRIKVKTDRNEGFAGEFLSLTAHSWGIRLAPENIETLRSGRQIEISIGDAVAGTVSLSGATPAIDEALASSSCT